MKKIFLIISFICVGITLSAQSIDDVTLVVSGDGATKEEATHVALRSAIEQAYGVFVSANTEIVNDELVKDEIATVTSGNIKSYQELSATILPNGNHLVSLQVVVSTKKLATYAQSKGASCEFAGAPFGANLRLLELNKKNTAIAFDNLLKQCKAIAPYLVEMKLEVGNPTLNGPLPVYVTLYSTPNMWGVSELIVSTLKALQIKKDQLESIKQMGAQVYPIDIITTSFKKESDIDKTKEQYPSFLKTTCWWQWDKNQKQPFFKLIDEQKREYSYDACFYAPFPFEALELIIKNATAGYYIEDNQENTYPINITPLIVGNTPWVWGYHDAERGGGYIKQDVNTSCYLFQNELKIYQKTKKENIGRISLPYSYLKPYKDKQTNENIYPKKVVGIGEFKLDIPAEVLIHISNFEILRNED